MAAVIDEEADSEVSSAHGRLDALTSGHASAGEILESLGPPSEVCCRATAPIVVARSSYTS
jgi:hypothetical protein